jgi:hypothetical protein
MTFDDLSGHRRGVLGDSNAFANSSAIAGAAIERRTSLAFKKTPPGPTVPDSPEKILLDLPRRKIPGVLLHQGEVMREYASHAVDLPDVALQLPTGSGKTLVALLIGEWRRRKFGEQVVFLCPTKQLVNQVAEQADSQYGLAVDSFTGRISDFPAAAKASYASGDRIAVTTYSGLFNTNPFFESPDVIILDDAHAAENYVATMWTVQVNREDHAALHAALCSVLKAHLDLSEYRRLTGQWDQGGPDTWVAKLDTPQLSALSPQLLAVLDEHTSGTRLGYAWGLLRDHLRACHMYFSSQEILIRPLIPPTWTHAPFVEATQRIYMSATLGAGGDLERLMGRSKIERLKVPKGWEQQGIGRRFFVFPEMSLNYVEAKEFRLNVMGLAGRSVVLVPNERARQEVAASVASGLGFTVFAAADLELSKSAFVQCDQAVAVMANRYDGIDFPGDDCRVLFIEGLPKATTLQERFLMSRMCAIALFNERIQTRVLQAVGRCTRALQDYSVVVASGSDLPEYLSNKTRRTFWSPELQAELEFGVEQSRDVDASILLDNISIFLGHDQAWEDVDREIVAKRALAKQRDFPGMSELAGAVKSEVEYAIAMWAGDFTLACARAESTLAALTDPSLKGYRALWHYLAGSAAWLADTGTPNLSVKARAHFKAAKKAASAVPWLVRLSQYQLSPPSSEEADDSLVFEQLERVEQILTSLGTLHDRGFSQREKEILDGILSSADFERAHVELGNLLGFVANKKEVGASPDPWWESSTVCLVFEDHAGAKSSSVLDATKARQAASHPNWIRSNVPGAAEKEIIPVLITPVTSAQDDAIPHLAGVCLWPLDEFRQWATNALGVVRQLRLTFGEAGDLFWRAEAADAFKANALDAVGLASMLKSKPAQTALRQKR